MGGETLEQATVRGEHTYGGILRTDELGGGFDLGRAKRRLVELESQIDAAIAKQEKLF